MIEAVIFDMDGLLIDSEPFWRESHKAVLARHGYEVTLDDVRAAAGKRTLDQVAVWRERFEFKTPTDQELADEITAGVIQAIHDQGRPLPGVTALIAEIHRHGVPMAVASSSATSLIDVVLDRLDIRQFMTAIHSGEDEARGKPFPDVFLSTAKTLGVATTSCLVFEDSLNGVLAAKAAGMRCIAVPEAPYNSADFEQAGADRVVGSLEVVHWPPRL